MKRLESIRNEASVVQPALLSRMNERQVLRAIQAQGPMSRAEVARYSGISAPTASKAVESLLRAGYLEENDAPEILRGRPARKLHLPTKSVQVLGLVIDAEQCRLVSAGLDGSLHDENGIAFPTPATYAELLDTAENLCRVLMAQRGMPTLGMGISLPGLMDYRQQRGILSPNVAITNGQFPVRDLTERLEIPCVMLQESHALCLAERYYGNARGLNDFAMLDVSAGVGLGVVSGGEHLTGHRGLAGEIGHITVVADGRPCGCGNSGCLETVACDAALAWSVSQRLGRRLSIEETITLLREGKLENAPEVESVCRYLAIGIASVINLFNPSTVFVHGRMFAAAPALFPRLREEAKRRALAPSFADCEVVLARGSKRQGAIAAVIEHLLSTAAPASAPTVKKLAPV